jgi:Glycosyl hydrolase family 12
MNRQSRVIGMMLTSLFAACSTGGGRADFDLKQVPGTSVFVSEKDFDATVVNGRFRLLNNVWNKGATTGRYRQKIFVNDDNGKPVLGWAWKWRDSSGVASYPEVMVGQSPWNGEAAPDSGFPFQAGTKNLIVSYDIALEATGSYNLAFEFWAISRPPASKDTITHEVMIWIAGERLGAAGNLVGKTTLGGNTFSIFQNQNHGDASGANQNSWTIVSLLADKPILHGPLDIGQIIDFLLKSHYLDQRLFIANLELGDEIQRGSGTTVIRNYAVNLD